MDLQNITEAFIHYLWKYRMLHPDLKTTNNQSVSILHPGIHNHDSGPDFQCARIRIGNTVWAGNVEIHIKSSDWFLHGHHKDAAYNNVILHVVMVNNRSVKGLNKLPIPTLSLQGTFNPSILKRYREISENLLWVPCIRLIKNVEKIYITSRIHSVAIDRLNKKNLIIKNQLFSRKMDWEECCYNMLCRQFGSKINCDQFEMLSNSLPAKILMKYHGNEFQLEALLFGQSGLLYSSFREKYPTGLRKEYRYLSKKHNLLPIPGYLWKFMRLRPAAFPTLRIAQLAQLYAKHQRVFQSILAMPTLNELYAFFNLTASGYWDTHYIFGKKGQTRKKKFGEQSIRLLLINGIIPMIHLYGDIMNKPSLCERAIHFLEDMPPEDNAVIRRWKEDGIVASNALESQGLLELRQSHCEHKKCLECSIGHCVLKQDC